MPVLNITKTYADAALLSSSDLDSFIQSIETFFNTTKLGSDNIADLGILSPNLATNSVVPAKLADGSVETSKLADAGVTAAKFANLEVTTAKLAADAVTPTKFIDEAVTADKFSDEAITWSKVARRSASTGPATAGNVVITGSCGNFTAGTNLGFGYVPITNQTAQIETTGRPVRIRVMAGSTSIAAGVSIGANGGGIRLRRHPVGDPGSADTVAILYSAPSAGSAEKVQPAASFKYLDNPPAGEYVYTLQVQEGSLSTPSRVTQIKMAVWEV
jgi:hypothetical protein